MDYITSYYDRLLKEIDDLVCKIHGLERDCEGMTQQCEALTNKNNGLNDDVKRYKTMYDNITIDNNAIKTKYERASNNYIKAVDDITKLKKQKTILTIALSISIIVMVIAIIF